MCPQDDLTNPYTESLPKGFDPRQHPTIALHFFGVIALPRKADAGDLDAADFGEAA